MTVVEREPLGKVRLYSWKNSTIYLCFVQTSLHQEAPGLSSRRTLHYLTSIGQSQFSVAEEIKRKNMIPEKLTCHAYMTSFQANIKRNFAFALTLYRCTSWIATSSMYRCINRNNIQYREKQSHSRVLARLASLTQIEELARRLKAKATLACTLPSKLTLASRSCFDYPLPLIRENHLSFGLRRKPLEATKKIPTYDETKD